MSGYNRSNNYLDTTVLREAGFRVGSLFSYIHVWSYYSGAVQMLVLH